MPDGVSHEKKGERKEFCGSLSRQVRTVGRAGGTRGDYSLEKFTDLQNHQRGGRGGAEKNERSDFCSTNRVLAEKCVREEWREISVIGIEGRARTCRVQATRGRRNGIFAESESNEKGRGTGLECSARK